MKQLDVIRAEKRARESEASLAVEMSAQSEIVSAQAGDAKAQAQVVAGEENSAQ